MGRTTWIACSLTSLFMVSSAVAADVDVGQKAPDFTLRGVDGATYALADHVGKRGVVLAWFPRAFTPG